MKLHHRPVRAGVVAVLGLGMTAAMGSLGSIAAAAAPAGPVPMVAIPNSVPATTDHQAGPFTSRNMTVQVALRPRNAAGMNRSLRAMYTKGSGSFHHWLAKGTFNARYAPTAATRNAVASYLRHAGLHGPAGLLAVPGPGLRIEREGVRRLPHHAAQLPQQEGHQVLPEHVRGAPPGDDRALGPGCHRPDQHGPAAQAGHAPHHGAARRVRAARTRTRPWPSSSRCWTTEPASRPATVTAPAAAA